MPFFSAVSGGAFARTASVLFLFVLSLAVREPAAAGSLERAHALYFRGQSAEALEAYRAILDSELSPDAALNAAVVAQEQGRHRESIALLERASRRFPGHPDLLSELGWAELNEGFPHKARPRFEAVLSSAPGRAWDQLGLAVADLETDRLTEAHDRLCALVEEEPRLSLAHHYLGLVYERLGRTEAAVESWRRAIKEDSHFVEARLDLAAALESAGRPEEAWSEFARINYADPRNRVAHAGLQRLSKRISRRPEEIIPPRRIESPTPVPPPPPARRRLRVGIASSGGGAPTPKKNVSFRTSHAFRLEDADGTVRAAGAPGESWEIRLVETKSPFGRVLDASGTVRAEFRGAAAVRMDTEKPTTILNTLRFAPGMAWGGVADREIRGELRIAVDARSRRLVLVNEVGLEEYVYGVLAAEMPSHWPLEALKAQAVIARTLAVYRSERLRLHRRHGYDLCDEQHCQVYTGVRVENDKVRRATDETSGLIVAYDGKAAHTVFSSNCGGSSQSGAQAGWGHLPYWKMVPDIRGQTAFPETPWDLKQWLRGRPDIYCASSAYVWHPEFRWSRIVTAATVAERLARKKRIGRVRQIHVARRNASGRVERVDILGTAGRVTLTREHEIRRYLGLGLLRSTQFLVDTVVRDGRAAAFVFRGGGWGHGVGLCQSGAAGRAEAGAGFSEILVHYYPGARLTQVP